MTLHYFYESKIMFLFVCSDPPYDYHTSLLVGIIGAIKLRFNYMHMTAISKTLKHGFRCEQQHFCHMNTLNNSCDLNSTISDIL